MIDAIRSMAECIASVMIATGPVTTPATILSTISTEFEAIEIAAAREREPGPCVSARQPCRRLPHSAPAVGDRVLLGVGELGHRAAAVAVGGHERAGRSRSRPSPRGSRPIRPRSGPRPCAPPAGLDVGDDAHVAHAPLAGRDLGAQLRRGSPRRWRARRRSARSALRGGRRAPRPRCRSRRRSRAGRWPAAAARALISAFSAKVVAGLGRQLDLVGQRLEPRAGQQALELAQLVGVAGREDERHRRAGLRRRRPPPGPSRSRSMPGAGERQQLVEVGAARAACARRWPGPRRGRPRRS